MKKNLGVLCHISSLNTPYGIGDFGDVCIDFVDFLASHNISIWQTLPLNKTNDFNCPYSGMCGFAIDEMFVSPDELIKLKLIKPRDANNLKKLKNTTRVNYSIVKKEKLNLLDIAFSNIDSSMQKKVEDFINKNLELEDYAIFSTMLNEYSVYDWRKLPKPLLNKSTKDYSNFVYTHKTQILKQEFIQYILYSQWEKILAYAKSKNIKILGDIPVYPDRCSYDVYAYPNMYKLDKKTLLPTVTGGVPGDDFCAAGQNWGTCVYNWTKIEKENFAYFVKRFKQSFKFCNVLRLDHFIGLVKHYEISTADTSITKWVKGGGNALFSTIKQNFKLNNFIIEDLGVTMPEAVAIKNKYNLKGMAVLQFALGDTVHQPKYVAKNNIYYLGTHDNNTFLGYLISLSNEDKNKFCKLMNIANKNNKQILIDSVKAMLNSKADTVILQMQDYLLQDEKSRMNYPGQAADCWEYRMPKNFKKQFVKTLNLIKK